MIRSVSANSDSAGEFAEHKGNGKTEKNYWMSDSSVKNCFDCGKSFSTIRRRHHCRFCGQIFCWKCAPVRAPPINKRSCDQCLKIQKNLKTPPESPYGNNRTAGKSLLINSSLNLSIESDDIVFIGSDSSDNRESLTSLFKQFQRTESAADGTFSGASLLTWLSKDTDDDDCSARLANRMLEFELFSEAAQSGFAFLADSVEFYSTRIYRPKSVRRSTSSEISLKRSLSSENTRRVSFDSVPSVPSAASFGVTLDESGKALFQNHFSTTDIAVSSAPHKLG